MMLRILKGCRFHCSTHHRDQAVHAKFFYSNSTNNKKVDIDCGGSAPLEISSGQLARLADGSAVARIGNTCVMTTVVSKGKPSKQNFLPLTVDYRQKAAAAGRIPTNHLRRELGPSEREILAGRMIDRSIRPLFKKGYNIETGVTCNLMAVDGVHDPEVLSIVAASAALSLSDVPWSPAVGAVRLGYLNGQLVVNPTRKQLSSSLLNLVVAGTSEGLATMLEGDAKCLDHKTFLEAIHLGLEHSVKIAESIESLAREMGKPKRVVTLKSDIESNGENKELQSFVDTYCAAQLKSIYTDYSLDKLSRDNAMFKIRDDMISKYLKTQPEADPSLLSDMFSSLSTSIVRDLIFQDGLRVDGRSLTDLRPISCDVNLHPPLHGSALFQRGQTQVLCTVALDSLHSAMKLDPMSAITGGMKEKNFMLHYEFPGYATGDLGKGGSRRELGHGALAERALRQVLLPDNQFTVRLTSEVLESNGSSSMASICGGSLALLDAGIPLSELASGVAMGLVTRDGEQKVLTDIMGMEDFLGDMDFKFSATRSGVCALQSDVKIPGISVDIIKQAVEEGMDANHRILDIMSSCINVPREEKASWPVSRRLDVPAHKRGKFLGQAGLNLRRITQETGVQITAESEGIWHLFAPNPEAMAEADAMIEEILMEEKVPELEFGGIYTGKITEILDRGVMLQLHPQLSPVLLHNTQLSATKIHHPSALNLKTGDELQVKFFGRDPATGQMRLSRKALTISSAAAVKNLQASAKRKHEEEEDRGQREADGENLLPPRLQINENRDNMFTVDPQDYRRSDVPRVQSKPWLDITKLFSSRIANDQTVNFETSTTKPEPVKSHLELGAADKSGIDDSAYYEIDRIFNCLTGLAAEIKVTKQRKDSVDQELNYARDNLNSLHSSSSGLLPQDLMRERQNLKKLSGKSKAINESLLLQLRQYRKLKEELDTVQLKFDQPEQLKELMLKTTSFFLDLLNPDQLEQSIHDEEGRKGEEGEEDVFCRESSDKEVLKELVQETVRHSRPSTLKSSRQRPTVRWDKDRWFNLADLQVDISTTAPARSDQEYQRGGVPGFGQTLTTLASESLYTPQDRRRLQVEKLEVLRMHLNHDLEWLSSFRLPAFLDKKLLDQFIEKNYNNFLALASSPDQQDGVKIADEFVFHFLKHLKKLYKTAVALSKKRTMVECVEQTLGLTKVPEVTLAYQSLDKQEARLMSTWPEKVTESPNHLDQDFPVICGIELSREKRADLDDWRNGVEQNLLSNVLKDLTSKIDDCQERMDSYSATDLEHSWEAAEATFLRLKGLKVEALSIWLQETKDKERTNCEGWLTASLRDTLLAKCAKYTELNTTRRNLKKPWLNFRQEDMTSNQDLNLIYDNLRSLYLKTKYASLEINRVQLYIKLIMQEQTNLQTNNSFSERVRKASARSAKNLRRILQSIEDLEHGIANFVIILSNEDTTQDQMQVAEKVLNSKRNMLQKKIWDSSIRRLN